MAEQTYYFNARGDAVWSLPDNIVDNNLGTFGYTSSNGAAQLLTGNSCPATDLGIITKVELRLYGKGDGDDHIDITPIFTGGDGDPHETTPVVSPGDWTAPVDITNDPNHPDWSLWSHIQTLDCKLAFRKQAKANTVHCAKVEIRVTYTPPPDPPTNVAATDGEHIDKVVITWTKSAGATGYQVYRDDTPLGWLGDVDTYDDTEADAPTITPGVAAASDGTSPAHVSLSLSGQSANGGTHYSYKVRARNAVGESGDSEVSAGFRGVGALTYQWQRSAADSDENYSNIDGATTESYDDTGAPADGSGRYYRCVENATGATQQISAVDRGYRWTWEPPVADIDVGADPIDRTSRSSSGYTRIDKNNPANASGILHSVAVWVDENISGLIVGTFYVTNGNTLKCRDSELIGDVAAGFHTITELSITVVEGDYIGCYFTDGWLESDITGFAGYWVINAEYIDPNDEAEYGFVAGDAISLYGYGDIEAPPEYIPRHSGTVGVLMI